MPIAASPESVLVLSPRVIEPFYGAGNWKDVRSVNLLLSALSKQALFHTFDHEDPESIPDVAQFSTKDIIVHYSLWPAVLKRLRHSSAAPRLHVRAHNAEAFQHWQRMVHAESRPSYARIGWGAARLLAQDISVKRGADTVLGISEWDNRNYWSRLPGRTPVLDVPYVSPWPELRPQVHPLAWEARRPVVLSMPGGSDAIGLAALRNFRWLAEAFEGAGLGGRWDFLLSPGWDEATRSHPAPPLRPYPGPFEPWDALCSVRATAVLTPLGFGCKTSITDAIVAGCHVLVDARLMRRIPTILRARCIPVKCGQPLDAAALEERLNTAPETEDLHAATRQEALNGLRAALQ